MTADTPRSLRPKRNDLFVQNLAFNIGALQDHRPGSAALDWATHQDPIDVPQHTPYAVEHIGIVEIGTQAQPSGGNLDCAGQTYFGTAIVDDEVIANMGAAAPAHERIVRRLQTNSAPANAVPEKNPTRENCEPDFVTKAISATNIAESTSATKARLIPISAALSESIE